MDQSDPNFQGLDFYIKNEVLYLNKNPDLGVSILNNSPYIITDSYRGGLEDLNKSNFDKNLTLLLLALDEITTKNYNKVKASKYHTDTVGSVCAFFDTYYVYNTAFGSSASKQGFGTSEEKAALQGRVGDISSCSKIGGVDTSCLTGSHVCVSTQAYCCP